MGSVLFRPAFRAVLFVLVVATKDQTNKETNIQTNSKQTLRHIAAQGTRDSLMDSLSTRSRFIFFYCIYKSDFRINGLQQMEFTEKLVDNSERKTKIGFFIFLSLIDGYGPCMAMVKELYFQIRSLSCLNIYRIYGHGVRR